MPDLYQAYCNDCGWQGPGDEQDVVRRTEEMHAAETGHTNTEIHEVTSGGGYKVTESSTGEVDSEE